MAKKTNKTDHVLNLLSSGKKAGSGKEENDAPPVDLRRKTPEPEPVQEEQLPEPRMPADWEAGGGRASKDADREPEEIRRPVVETAPKTPGVSVVRASGDENPVADAVKESLEAEFDEYLRERGEIPETPETERMIEWDISVPKEPTGINVSALMKANEEPEEPVEEAPAPAKPEPIPEPEPIEEPEPEPVVEAPAPAEPIEEPEEPAEEAPAPAEPPASPAPAEPETETPVSVPEQGQTEEPVLEEPEPMAEPEPPAEEPVPVAEPETPAAKPEPMAEPEAPAEEPAPPVPPSAEPETPAAEPAPMAEPETPAEEPVPAAEPETPAAEPETPVQQKEEEMQPVQQEKDYTMVNVMEYLVREQAPKYIRQFGHCDCDRCIEDTVALTLTHLPAKYVVVNKNAVSPLLNFYEKRYAGQLIVEITKATMIVNESPNH